jgi:hypothetical protein
MAAISAWRLAMSWAWWVSMSSSRASTSDSWLEIPSMSSLWSMVGSDWSQPARAMRARVMKRADMVPPIVGVEGVGLR